VNLDLQVLGRRPDGYHDLRSVFHAVDLCDRLEFRAQPDADIHLTCDHPDLPCDESNLVVRAARLLQRHTGARRGAAIRLRKRIPMGGGLGGGSSNAAVTLLALNHLWGTGLGAEELNELAAELGSDVAFFLYGGTAVCTGRGEQVAPVDDVPELHFLLVLPGLHVSTPAVYGRLKAGLTTRREARNNVLVALSDADFERLGRSLQNDLQEAAYKVEDRLRSIADALQRCARESGAQACLLSGSGSSFFILAEQEAACRRCATVVETELDLPCVVASSYPAWHTRVEKLIARRGSP
jgi:4-diphosphocytidyl-2-C-methyl-D-erythritol kinase